MKQFPASDEAHVGLARLLRKSGCAADAGAVLAPRQSRPNPSRELLLEASDVAFENGEYGKSSRLLHAAHDDDIGQLRQSLGRSVRLMLDEKAGEGNQVLVRSRTTATTFALADSRRQSEWLFDELDSIDSQLQHRHDLRVRLDQAPNDQAALQELNQLVARMSALGKQDSTKVRENSTSPLTPELDLYAVHCAACHGVDGDGNGPASRHLEPHPARLSP